MVNNKGMVVTTLVSIIATILTFLIMFTFLADVSKSIATSAQDVE